MAYCPECGAKNEDGAKFCGSCGKALDALPAAALPERKGFPFAVVIALVLVVAVAVVAFAVWQGRKNNPEALAKSLVASVKENNPEKAAKLCANDSEFITEAINAGLTMAEDTTFAYKVVEHHKQKVDVELVTEEGDCICTIGLEKNNGKWAAAWADASAAMFQGNPHRTGVFSSREIEQLPRVKWWFRTEERVVSLPVISGDTVYFGTGDGCRLIALDSKTGQEKWRFKTEGCIYSTPAIAGGTVYFGDEDGYLYALDSKTGQEKWRFKTGDSWISSPAIAGGTVYFGCNWRLLCPG